MVRKYEVLVTRELRGTVFADVGDTVYDCRSHDYGCANDDTRHFGVEHVSVTCSPEGDYPFFTIPKSHIREIKGDIA